MRSYLVALSLAAAPPAVACPIGALCAIVDAPREEVRAPPRPISLRLESVPERPRWDLRALPPDADDNTPWIWRVLHREVYARMPRYRDKAFTFVLSPVVVAGTFDTVPGIGVAGDF